MDDGARPRLGEQKDQVCVYGFYNPFGEKGVGESGGRIWVVLPRLNVGFLWDSHVQVDQITKEPADEKWAVDQRRGASAEEESLMEIKIEQPEVRPKPAQRPGSQERTLMVQEEGC